MKELCRVFVAAAIAPEAVSPRRQSLRGNSSQPFLTDVDSPPAASTGGAGLVQATRTANPPSLGSAPQGGRMPQRGLDPSGNVKHARKMAAGENLTTVT
eukprot:8808080-Pyramimonas_sp.AAC.1